MAGSKKKCYVNFLGCEKRKLDAQRVIDYLRANEYGLTSRIADAEVVVFLTCAFCNKYENYSVAKLGKIYAQKQPGTTFIVGGCLPTINPGALAPFPETIQIPTRELDNLDRILHTQVLMETIPDPNTTIFDKKDDALPLPKGFKSPAQCQYEAAKRGFKIRIDWGCLGNCAYCVTRLAEGSLRSKSIELVLNELKRGLEAGSSSFFFTGGDAGAYGLDVGSSIVNLLSKILAIEGHFVIHFHDFGIQWLLRYLNELLPLFQANVDKLGCFCFPIQSGSNRILKLMRRPYTKEEIYSTLHRLKLVIPTLKIGTHFIVGFPGESEADFQQTIHMIRDLPFDFIEVYRYADHERADSNDFAEKVPAHQIIVRNEILDQIFQEKISHQLKKIKS